MDEDWFDPGPGRMRASRYPSDRKYLNSVLAAAGRRQMPKGAARQRFNGARIGRGSVAARMLCQPERFEWTCSRRALVKTRVVRLGGIAAARMHLRYIERDGVSREGQSGRLYSAEDDGADGKGFLDRSRGDRHQFRFVVSVEDGAEYDDLRPLIRRFMGRMEEDLSSRLDWVAADHFDTFHPHTHIVLRGKDELGADLIIAPDYLYRGIGVRASELVSLDLGPKIELASELRRRLEVDAERLTSIDRELLKGIDGERILRPHGRSVADHVIEIGRLRKLHSLGLAEPLRDGRWRIAEELEPTLCSLGEQRDVVRKMQRVLTSAGIEHGTSELVIYRPESGSSVTGRIVSCRLAGLADDRHELVVDGIDGRSHYVVIGTEQQPCQLPDSAIIRISPGPKETPAINGVHAGSPQVELLSLMPLERLAVHDGATWLDRELIDQRVHPRDAGFGSAVRSALAQRRTWLVDQGLASPRGEQLTFRSDMLELLRRREFLRTLKEISMETGLDYVAEGAPIQGILRRRVDLASSRFAMIENGREFALLSWQPALQHSMGKEVAATVRPNGAIAWEIGRRRGLEL